MKFYRLFLSHPIKVITISLSIIFSLIDIIFHILNISPIPIINDLILGLFAVLLSILLKLEDKIDNIKIEYNKNLTKFYHNRNELPSLQEEINRASVEISIWSICMGIIANYSGLIETKLKQNCKINILIMSKTDEKGNENLLLEHAAKISKDGMGLKSRLEVAYQTLRGIYTRLNGHEKELLQIRSYLIFPTANYLFFDKDTNNGIIRVEPSLMVRLVDLPSFEISASSKLPIYNVFIESFNDIWEKSKKVEFPE